VLSGALDMPRGNQMRDHIDNSLLHLGKEGLLTEFSGS
jgi:hypothetical protein